MSLEIIAIETNKGYYISSVSDQKKAYYSYNTTLDKYYFNGNKAVQTFDKNWMFIPEEPISIQEEQSQPNINYRYELIDKSFASDKIPEVIMKPDVGYTDDEGDFCWNDTYKTYSSLYEYKYDKQPNIMADVEFTFSVIMKLEVDEIKEPLKMKYPVQRTQYKSDGLTDLTNNAIEHQLIDKIMFPSILLPETPCRMSSEQMYKIIRQHIKQHINYDYAKITSDYDFCFTVKKKINLAEPFTQQWEVTKNNGKSYRPPRYDRRYVSVREVEVFEMTYSPKNYQGYTSIPSIEASNEDELKMKINTICSDIIKVINEPFVDCPHCKGVGVINKDKINTKEIVNQM